jgi:hypothetical protein
VSFIDADARGIPFRKTDKGPYGTYVLYDQISFLFPNADISISHEAPAEKLKYSSQQSRGYIAIAPYIEYSKKDIAAFDNFLRQGNVLILSAFMLDEEVEKWLNVKLGINYTNNKKDSINIFDTDSANYLSFSTGKVFNSYIAKYDSSASGMQVFGRSGNGMPNFICFKKNNGLVVIHTNPYMFSNYHLIKKKTKNYTEVFFSSLPGPLNSVIWDEYTKQTSGYDNFSALSFIMNQPALRSAFWWAFAGLLLVVFFSFKRRQKIIPVLTPLTNNSVDMVRTVSDMYFYSHRNEVMAKKKIAYWLEYLRVKYNIFTNHSPDAFWQTVKLRSNISDDKISSLRIMVETYRNGDERISDVDLIKLNNLIDSFYTS